jgi:ABC-type uncharacterized transport system permease subunit
MVVREGSRAGYALTLIVLAFFGGQARDPSALGIPYIRT